MTVRQVLQLGSPQLYDASAPLEKKDLDGLVALIQDLHDTLMDFRDRYGAGRAIAAPQIGFMRRLVYMHVDRPVIMINPVLDQKSPEMMEVWDDCMCFPDLLVKVQRHRRCRITFRDLSWQEHSLLLEDDISELLQHECDHLDGILATARALDGRAFAMKSQRHLLD